MNGAFFLPSRSGRSAGDSPPAARSGPAALAAADAGRGQQPGSSAVALAVAAVRQDAAQRAGPGGHAAREEEQHLLRRRDRGQSVIHHAGYLLISRQNTQDPPVSYLHTLSVRPDDRLQFECGRLSSAGRHPLGEHAERSAARGPAAARQEPAAQRSDESQGLDQGRDPAIAVRPGEPGQVGSQVSGPD